ncbi:hypothetical protein ACFFNY_19080 [Paenibacillus hodogayensis]|uniref:Uncharacterized protein n=1 Tax=Paenibacillus hodogayensis TaxID=279208 RepID=A0ABV5VZE4_9BACL
MILYRLAKWMEERMRLKRLIAEAEGDCALYKRQKRVVERQMLQEAFDYMKPGAALSAESAIVLYTHDLFGVQQPVFGLDETAGHSADDWREVLTEARASFFELAGREQVPGRRNEEPLHAEELLSEEWLRTVLEVDGTAQPQP